MNLTADLKAALELLPDAPNPLRAIPYSPDWQELRSQLPLKWERVQLARFGRYCSATGIAPGEVSDATLESFRRFLDHTSLAKDPDKVVKVSDTLSTSLTTCAR